MSYPSDSSIEDMYFVFKPLIRSLSYKYSRRFGFDPSEGISFATSSFVEAYREFQEESPNYPIFTYIYLNVKYSLIRYMKRESRYDSKESMEPCLPAFDLKEKNFVVDFGDELSEDARTLMKALLETPSELRTYLDWNEVKYARQVRQSASEYFQDLGWKRDYFADTWNEIKEALTA